MKYNNIIRRETRKEREDKESRVRLEGLGVLEVARDGVEGILVKLVVTHIQVLKLLWNRIGLIHHGSLVCMNIM